MDIFECEVGAWNEASLPKGEPFRIGSEFSNVPPKIPLMVEGKSPLSRFFWGERDETIEAQIKKTTRRFDDERNHGTFVKESL